MNKTTILTYICICLLIILNAVIVATYFPELGHVGGYNTMLPAVATMILLIIEIWCFKAFFNRIVKESNGPFL